MRSHLTRALPVALVVAVALAASSPAIAAPSWGPPTTLGPTEREAGGPEIAVAPDGEAIAAWEGSRPDSVKVSSRPPGGDWSRPVMIAGVGEEIEGPRVAVSARKAVIVWTDNIRARRGTALERLLQRRIQHHRCEPFGKGPVEGHDVFVEAEHPPANAARDHLQGRSHRGLGPGT
jgi:hypothetical protein